VILAAAVALVALFVPLPRTGGDGTRAALVPTPAGPGQANVAITLGPPDAANGNQWFEILSWALRLAEPRRAHGSRATVPSTWPPPAAPA
jgi:hypothetical protein